MRIVWVLLAVVAVQFAEPARSASAPIEPLPGVADQDLAIAQQLLIGNPEALRRVTDPATGRPMRAAVFHAAPATAADVPGDECRGTLCYRLDVYNYALNATFSALVDVPGRRLLRVGRYQPGQPQLPAHLARRALEIAVAAPEVEQALGFTPSMDRALMPDVKTALNNTECESSRHLCVAPTFVFEEAERALWVIVDLTAERVAGVRWTDLGAAKRIRPTEQSIQRDAVYDRFCRERQAFARGDWRFEYIITPSDGLELTAVRYRGAPVLESAKLVDWHVSYSRDEGFGYSDAVGCPRFSSAAVPALAGPVEEDLLEQGEVAGFAFVQDFFHPLWPAPCNYRYKQRFEFYDDGRFRVAAGQYGRGCGTEGTYRPVTRIRPAADGFSEWGATGWVQWERESWQKQGPDTRYSDGGFQYRVGDEERGWYLEPGRGQFPFNRGDNAWVYVTAHHPDQGDADLVTVGACCNNDHRQGPEHFIGAEPEALDGAGLVIWYVASLKNDNRPGEEYCWADNALDQEGLYEPRAWPCYSGPMFHPYGSPVAH